MQRVVLLPVWTLFKKEVFRYLRAPTQTLVAPVITASLFLFIFGVNLGSRISVFEGFSYLQFVVPGLVLMGVINNAFLNTSSSIYLSRYIGNIVELLVTPLSGMGMSTAYTLAAMTRGLIVGAIVLVISLFFTKLPMAHPGLAFLMACLTSLQLSQLGIIAAIYSDSFESLSMYNTFLLLPLTYLGGLFYPLSILPPVWRTLSLFNPLFYTIDGFRHCLIGHGDVSLAMSFGVTSIVSFGLFFWASYLLRIGHRLRT